MCGGWGRRGSGESSSPPSSSSTSPRLRRDQRRPSEASHLSCVLGPNVPSSGRLAFEPDILLALMTEVAHVPNVDQGGHAHRRIPVVARRRPTGGPGGKLPDTIRDRRTLSV